MPDRKGPLTDYDLHLFNEGSYALAYEKFGAHPDTQKGVAGTRFAVWAPNAREVSVVGDFNGWNRDTHRLEGVGSSGVWQGFVPGVKQGDCYKFFIRSNVSGYEVEKSDPFGFSAELRPKTASVVWNIEDYAWGDTEWMA
ncbi:MAG: 1,4-alpha-glucan branching enzyme, partial [Deltaproteobacteria bacterium]|nr:1,4-alpha-glucan branching enzyme [Deltaproteobacteria bacterium]